MTTNHPKRGDVYLANLDPVIGTEQGKVRPVLMIQNDLYNKYGTIVIVATISGRAYKGYMTDVFLDIGTIPAITKPSIVVGNQIRSIDKQRLIRLLGTLPTELMKKVDEALRLSLQLMDV